MLGATPTRQNRPGERLRGYGAVLHGFDRVRNRMLMSSRQEEGWLGKRKEQGEDIGVGERRGSVEQSVDDNFFANTVELVTRRNQLKMKSPNQEESSNSEIQQLLHQMEHRMMTSATSPARSQKTRRGSLKPRTVRSSLLHSPAASGHLAQPQIQRANSAALPINQQIPSPDTRKGRNKKQTDMQKKVGTTDSVSQVRLPKLGRSLEARIRQTLNQIRSTQDEDLDLNAELLEDILKSFASACSLNLDQAVRLISKDTGHLNMEVIRSKLAKFLPQ